MKRLVIKIGSNVLSREDHSLDITRVSALVDQVVALHRKGYEIILVSSGAVACGRSIVKSHNQLDSVAQRQLYSAAGQAKLINTYYNFFSEYGIIVGQVLTMKNNFAPGSEYDNQKNCMSVMLEENVIPIVNENDTVCITELMFTDNDELSGLVARMMNADALIILSDIDGLYDGDPSLPSSKILRKVTPDMNIESFISSRKSAVGRGGMESKAHTAMGVSSDGIKVFIANGKTDNILVDIIENPESAQFTEFTAR